MDYFWSERSSQFPGSQLLSMDNMEQEAGLILMFHRANSEGMSETRYRILIFCERPYQGFLEFLVLVFSQKAPFRQSYTSHGVRIESQDLPICFPNHSGMREYQDHLKSVADNFPDQQNPCFGMTYGKSAITQCEASPLFHTVSFAVHGSQAVKLTPHE